MPHHAIVGVKVTLIRQLWPGSSCVLAEQSVPPLGCWMKFAETLRPLKVSGGLPPFETVTVWVLAKG